MEPASAFWLFWLINLAVILKGIEYIRFLQGISAPVLLGVGLLLLGWAYARRVDLARCCPRLRASAAFRIPRNS